MSETNALVTRNTQVAGEYTLTRIKASTGEVVEERKFDNLITDLGMNEFGVAGQAYSFYVYVGAGNTPEAVTDTVMGNLLYATLTQSQPRVSVVGPAPDYVASSTYVWDFEPKGVAYNVSEVGVGWSHTSISALFSRALVKDSNGQPIVISVLADEFLRVTYTLKMYPDLSEKVTQIVVNGTTYTITARPASVTSNVVTADRAAQPRFINLFKNTFTFAPITSLPTDYFEPSVSLTKQAYVAGSYKAAAAVTFSPSQYNVAFSGFVVGSYTPFQTTSQIKIEPLLTKTSQHSLTLTFVQAWSRKT